MLANILTKAKTICYPIHISMLRNIYKAKDCLSTSNFQRQPTLWLFASAGLYVLPDLCDLPSLAMASWVEIEGNPFFPGGSPNSYISGSRPRILSRTECNVHQESIIHVSQKPKPFPRVEVTWAMPEKNIKFLVMSSLMTMETILATSQEPKVKSQKVSQIMWENQPTSCMINLHLKI